jgi:hypothetical protein
MRMPKVPMSRDLLISKILIGEEKEKQQIIDAFKNGFENGNNRERSANFFAENYYTKTFNDSHKQ